MEKLHPKGVALASTLLSAAGYILCVFFFAIAPRTALQFFNIMFHGIDITKIATEMLSVLNIVLGFVEIVVLSFAGGWLFAVFYNIFAKKSS